MNCPTGGSLIEISWDVLSGLSGIAALEIMVGSRSDRDLADALEPVQTAIELESHRRIKQMVETAGVQNSREHFDLVELVIAAIRGLSIERLYRRGGSRRPTSLKTLRDLIEARLI